MSKEQTELGHYVSAEGFLDNTKSMEWNGKFWIGHSNGGSSWSCHSQFANDVFHELVRTGKLVKLDKGN